MKLSIFIILFFIILSLFIVNTKIKENYEECTPVNTYSSKSDPYYQKDQSGNIIHKPCCGGDEYMILNKGNYQCVCTPEGGDMWNHPDTNGNIQLPCCPGLQMKNENGKLICRPDGSDACTPDGGDMWNQPNNKGKKQIPCCSGLQMKNENGKLMCRSDSSGGVTPPEPKDPCDGMQCGINGKCSNGTCECSNGWSGNNCEIMPLSSGEKAVIVIRHGQDIDGIWDSNQSGWNYSLPSGKSVTTYLKGLSDSGLNSASSYSYVLPKLIKDLRIQPITRVVVDNPEIKNSDGTEATPNPFNTIYPFIIRKQIEDVDMPRYAQFGNLTPSNNDGSIIIVSTVQNLWGKDDNKDTYKTPRDDKVIGILNKKYGIREMTISPQKGRTIYVYRYDKNGNGYVKIYNLESNRPPSESNYK
jgi:hypothetical protein